MRRVFFVVCSALVGGALVAMACTTFDGLDYDAGAATDALSDTPVDAADAGPTTYMTTTDAEILCSLAVKCPTVMASIGVSVGLPLQLTTPRFSTCVSWLSRAVTPSRRGFAVQRAMFDALRSARTCNATIPLTYVALTADGCDGSVCNAQGAVSACSPVGRVVSDCRPPWALAGSSCAKSTSGPLCERPVAACPASPTCTGDITHVCVPGSTTLEVGTDCSRTGLACVGDGVCADPADRTTCQGASDIGAECLATLARICVPGQPRTTIDCARAGLGCTPIGTTAVCTSPTDECTPATAGIDTCDGSSKLVACVAGKRTTIDCASLGYARCSPVGSGHCE